MEEPNKLNRETYLDIVGGLLLIYMICWHCALASGTAAEFKKYTFWLGFFLPWFFFKGGLFFKPRENKEVIKIGYKRLIIPFLWFSLIGTIILWTGQIINGDFTIYTVNKNIIGFFAYGSFYGNLALWFLLSLYAVRIIFNYFFIKIKNSPSRFYKYLWGGGLRSYA